MSMFTIHGLPKELSLNRMVFSTELQVPYIITYALDFGPSGSVETQISSG